MRTEVNRVLIVDPDQLFARRTSGHLAARGYDVETAAGIAEAVDRLRDMDFACLIVDEALPEIRGYDAVPILKTIAPNVPIIMTATRNSPELESRIRQQDVFFYHVKPFAVGELEMAVRDACRSQMVRQMSTTRVMGPGPAVGSRPRWPPA